MGNGTVDGLRNWMSGGFQGPRPGSPVSAPRGGGFISGTMPGDGFLQQLQAQAMDRLSHLPGAGAYFGIPFQGYGQQGRPQPQPQPQPQRQGNPGALMAQRQNMKLRRGGALSRGKK